MSTKYRLLIILALLIVSTSAFADPISYTGSLSYDTGLNATSNWQSPVTQISWVVSRGSIGPWTYAYTITAPQRTFSHLIFEVSDDFTAADYFNLSVFDNDTNTPFSQAFATIGTHPGYGINDPTQPNPFMPENVYGMKIDGVGGLNITVSFQSWRDPVWADFYAKCGQGFDGPNTMHNKGFTAFDTDPADPPSSGSINNHILAPNSYVPEPGTSALMILGAIGMAVFIRRRNSS